MMPSAKYSLRLIHLCLILVSIVQGNYRARTEEVKPGRCPTYNPMAGFASSRLTGSWYVAHQFQRNNRFLKCQELNITADPNDERSFQIDGTVRVNPRMSLQTAGHAFLPDPANPAYMRWTWDYFPALLDHVTVLDTDYNNYAVVVLCQDYVLFHVVYPMLFTREKPLNVTDQYEAYYTRAQKVIPFPVANRYSGSGPSICSLDKYFPDVDVKLVDIDKSIKEINKFTKTLV